jgi:hypothetical protein
MCRAVCVVALILNCSLVHAQVVEKVKQAPHGKTARLKRESVQAGDKGAEALPCPRATWKDDPVCFGEDVRDTLPTPSVASIPHDRAPSEGPTLKPTANLNPRPSGPGPYQAGVVYQSNGNAVTSNYGGGVRIELPF